MLDIKASRYIPIPVFVDSKGQYVPIWDSRLQFREGSKEGDSNYKHPVVFIRNEEDYVEYELTEVIYDIVKKTINPCIDIDLYPSATKFKQGEEVYIEESPRVLSESTIKGILYRDCSTNISKGKYINQQDLDYIRQQKPNLIINPELIYCVNRWHPSYVLSDDRIIEFDNSIYKKKFKTD